MRILRKMQKGLSDGRRCDGQLEEKKERNRVYPVHGMCEKLPEECALTVRRMLQREPGIHGICSFKLYCAANLQL